MREELLLERAALKHQMSLLTVYFMKETDKEESLKILSMMKDRAKRVEEINCKLAHMQIVNLFKRDSV